MSPSPLKTNLTAQYYRKPVGMMNKIKEKTEIGGTVSRRCS
jgi:hypothetical protein